MNNKTIITAIVALIVGFLIGWLTFAPTNDAVVPEDVVEDSEDSLGSVSDTLGDATITINGDESLLIVHDQAPGTSVAVEGLSLENPVWLTVQDSNSGAIGNILGAQKFFPGQSVGVIELLRPTLVGMTYFVAAYADDGQQIFDWANRAPITDQNDAPVRISFTASN